MLIRKSLALLFLCVVAAMPGNAFAGIIVNGGFDTINGAQLSKLGDLGGAYSNPQAWTIGHNGTGTGVGFVFDSSADNSPTGGSQNPGSSTVFLWGPDTSFDPQNNGFYESFSGGKFIGLMANAPGDGLQQTLSGLTSGSLYRVDFEMAGAQIAGELGPTTQSLDVYFGTAMQSTSVLNTPQKGFSNWVSQSLTFTAGGATPQLAFVAGGSGNGSVVLLDGVSVTLLSTPVPEPGTVAISALAIAGVVVSRLRRRKQSTTVDA